jgi:Asp-tRNA(Asn)/Glu-tRNA(Gln) amidotransferase C subunit
MTVELLAEIEILKKKVEKYETALKKIRSLVDDYDEKFCDGDEAMVFVKKYCGEVLKQMQEDKG